MYRSIPILCSAVFHVEENEGRPLGHGYAPKTFTYQASVLGFAHRVTLIVRLLVNVGQGCLPLVELARLSQVRYGFVMSNPAEPSGEVPNWPYFVQGAIFEIVTTDVNNIPIPDSVFAEFDLELVTRYLQPGCCRGRSFGAQ